MQPNERQAAQASMAGIIERLAGDLTLAEEPSQFIAALEGSDEDVVEEPSNE